MLDDGVVEQWFEQRGAFSIGDAPGDDPASLSDRLIGIRIRAHLRDWRRVPFPCKHLTLRSIKAHGQVERFFWRRKPICFLFGAWTLVLEIKVERTIRIIFERHPAADRKTIELVCNLE